MTNQSDERKDDPVDEHDWNAILAQLHAGEVSALMDMAKTNHTFIHQLGSKVDSMSYLIALSLHFTETMQRTVDHLKGREGTTERVIIFATTLERIAQEMRKTHGVDGVSTIYRQ